MPRTERTEHEVRIVMCLTTDCEQYRVGARQYAMQMALDPVYYEECERVSALVFFPTSCAMCGMEMFDQEAGENHGL